MNPNRPPRSHPFCARAARRRRRGSPRERNVHTPRSRAGRTEARAASNAIARAALLACVALACVALSPAAARAAVNSAASTPPGTAGSGTSSGAGGSSSEGSTLEAAASKAGSTGRKVAMSLIGLAFAVAGIVLAFRRDFKEAAGVFAVGIVAVLLATPAGINLLQDTVNSLFGS